MGWALGVGTGSDGHRDEAVGLDTDRWDWWRLAVVVLGTDGRSGGPQQRGLAGPYAAGDPRWPVWREVWGTFGWLVGEGEVGATVSGAAVRLGVACLAIGPGRH